MKKGVRPLAPTFAATTLRAERGLTPSQPTPLASQRSFPLEGWGEEEQGARPAADDLLTSYPGLGAKAPGSVASAPARALVWSAHRPWPYADFGFAASGPRLGASAVSAPARPG